MRGEEIVTDKKIIVQFTILTFCIAYLVSGALIALGQFGYSVHNWVHSLQEFGMNIPFAVYILSPAIASYIVLKKNNKITNFKEWLKTVFYAKNNIYLYLFVVAGLTLYFLIHIAVSGRTKMVIPFYTFFLSLPGNLIIGGLRRLVGCTYCSLGLTKNMALFYLLFLLESFGRHGISLFSLFRGRITAGDSLTFGCLQFNSLRFGFLTGQSTKYQEKAVCLYAYYSTPCLMQHPPSLAP
jgi:hypothetical protein